MTIKNLNSIDYFKEHGYLKIENFLDKNFSFYLYQYCVLATKRLLYLESTGENFDKEIYGRFDDEQAIGDYSKYGDLTFDNLMNLITNSIEKLIDLKLIPTYSYHRLYTTGTDLKKHKDRVCCEISVSLCLGYDVSNVDEKKYPDWDWPMFVKDKKNNINPIHLKPGDLIIYRGVELEHWREPFLGLNHAQAFLHYKEKDDNFSELVFDTRPALGLPGYTRNESLLNKKNIEYMKKIKK